MRAGDNAAVDWRIMNGEMQSCSAAQPDSYTHVVTAIQRNGPSRISVPELSKLLGVKATTLNARFRRQQTGVSTIGRTNFVPVDLALGLAELHKYALIGWPTLQQASRLTGVKTGTIKARCEKGRLEGYVDLTKRLRINPAALENLQWDLLPAKLHGGGTRGGSLLFGSEKGERPEVWPTNSQRRNGTRSEPPNGRGGQTLGVLVPEKQAKLSMPPKGEAEWTVRKPRPFVLPPAPDPQVNVLTERDYGIPELDAANEAAAYGSPAGKAKGKKVHYLTYDPDAPFSVSDCAVGQHILYGPYSGRIVQVVDDPFNPKILVKFPQHTHPLMRQVLLIVGKSHLAETV